MTKSKTVVITGGSAGVGRATARKFATAGFNVGVIARGEDGLEGAVRDIERLGSRGLGIHCDVSDAEAVELAAQQFERELGPIDVWVNNAMTSVFSPIHQMTADEFHRVTEVTYLGVVHGTLAALRRMRERNEGSIIQVGSALAYRGIPLQSAYCAAKHAIVGFTESLRTELLHDNRQVHVSVVHLPAMNTPQFGWVKSRLPNRAQPVPPIFEPELAAEAIHVAYAQRRREIWLTLSTIKTILGNRWIPQVLDAYLARVGYDSQQTDEPEDPARTNNLWEPVDANGNGDFGAHGSFGDSAHRHSWEFGIAQHTPWLKQAAVSTLGLAVGLIAARFLVE